MGNPGQHPIAPYLRKSRWARGVCPASPDGTAVTIARCSLRSCRYEVSQSRSGGLTGLRGSRVAVRGFYMPADRYYLGNFFHNASAMENAPRAELCSVPGRCRGV